MSWTGRAKRFPGSSHCGNAFQPESTSENDLGPTKKWMKKWNGKK